MKRLKMLVPLLLLVILGYCMPVSAEENKGDALIQWKTDDSQGSAVLTLTPTKDMEERAATTLQFTLQVTDLSDTAAGVEVIFDEETADAYRITDYTYDAERKILNIYLSDSKPLFEEEGQSCIIGTVRIEEEAEDCQIRVEPVLIKTVSQSHQTEELAAEEMQDMAVTLTKSSGAAEPEQPDTPDVPGGPDSCPVFDNASDVVNELCKGSASEVVYQIGVDGSITEEEQKVVFEALKGKDKAVTFAVTEGDRLLYSFTFRGDQIDKERLAMDMKLTVGGSNPDIEKLMPKGDKHLILAFSHNGRLPGRAEVKVYVGDTFTDGQKLYLYYYNSRTKAVEPVQKELVVVEGYVSFELTHCSDYVLTTKEIKEAGTFPVPGEQTSAGGAKPQKNAAATGDRAPIAIFIVLMAAAAAVIAAVIWRKRRK